MEKNCSLRKLKQDQQIIGTFLETNDTNTVEALGVAGLDFFIVDFEHGAFSHQSLLHIVQAAELREMTPFVRIKEITRPEVLRPLDMGVQGLIIPNIRTLEEVENVVRWGKYTPQGERGMFTSRISDYGFSDEISDFDAFTDRSNDEILLIPQCETKEALDIIDDIAAVDNVAGIFIGPYDLSIALGIPTQFDHPIFIEALEKIYKACRDNDIYAFIFGMDTNQAREYMKEGYDGIVCGFDTHILINATKSMIAELKE